MVVASPEAPLSPGKKPVVVFPVVPRPNLDEYWSEINQLQETLKNLRVCLNEVQEQIGDLNKGGNDFHRRREDIRRSVDEVQRQIDLMETERNQLLSQMDNAAKTGRDMKTKIQGLKKSLGYQSSADIDEKIRQVEKLIMSSRLKVPEENKLIAEIRALERSKPLVEQYATMESEAALQSQAATLELRVRVDAIKEELKQLHGKKRGLNEQLSALVQARSQTTKPVRELSDQKDDLRRQIGEAKLKLSSVKQEMHEKKLQYDAYQETVNQARRAVKEEEKKRRVVGKQREQLQSELDELEEGCWSSEMQLLNQTVLYLTQLVEKSKGAETVKSAQEEEESAIIPQSNNGMVALKPKKDRDEEYYYKSTTKKKTDKKAKKQGVVDVNQPIVHDISILSDFSRLGYDAPLTLAECLPVLQILDEKLTALKNDHSRGSEAVRRRKFELLAKLQELEDNNALAVEAS